MKENSLLNKIKKFIFSDYSKKQKIVSLLISIGFAIFIILLVIYMAGQSTNFTAGREIAFDNNPFFFIDDEIIDHFMIRRMKSFDVAEVLTRNPEIYNLAIIAIDEESLNNLKLSWPIPRSVYGKLLNQLKIGEAKTVGFDIIFQNPSTPKEDEIFKRALSKMKDVILVETIAASRAKLNPEKISDNIENEISLAFKAYLPYKPFAEAIKNKEKNNLAFVSISNEEVVRRVILEQNIDGIKHYMLPIVAVANYLDIPLKNIRNFPNKKYFQLGYYKIPTFQNLLRINYFVTPSQATYIHKLASRQMKSYINEFPIEQVLKEKDPNTLKRMFKDKLLLVGVTAEGAKDIKNTPFGRMPGIYSHANIIISIFLKRFINPISPLTNIIIIVLTGLIIGFAIPRLTPLAGAIFILLFSFSYYQYAYYQFLNHGNILFITSPILCASLGYIITNIYHHIYETKTKESFSKMFHEFAPLPSNLINKYIEEHGGSAETGGELQHVTVLFSDIRGYTSMSESMSPQEVVKILNKFHTEMGKIFEETGGVIYTYIGDAQLVVYGHEGLSKINHAAAAVKAGLMMQEKMKDIRLDLINSRKTPFEVGVGLCTGSLSVAIVGAQQRKQYTVIGDTVNVASRIQGMSKELDSPVLIHERTYMMARNCIEAEKLKPVKLKGKSELVNVYRAKRFIKISTYPGDEINDLNKEIETLHTENNILPDSNNIEKQIKKETGQNKGNTDNSDTL